MIASIRKKYNQNFTEAKYQAMLSDIARLNNGELDFRIAETPIFINRSLKNKLIKAGDEICSYITSPAFIKNTNRAFAQVATPPNENELPNCIVMDFAICENEVNELAPKLIELQGFPSLFGFEVFHNRAYQNEFNLPNGYSPYLNGYNEHSYIQFLNTIIKGTDPTKKTILLELFPQNQKTKIDFNCTSELIDIPIVCLSDIIVKNNHLYYIKNGIEILVDRIYNRIVWDELSKQPLAIQDKAKLLLQSLHVQWITHPNHYYRISKFMMPFLNSEFVPKSKFLNEVELLPNNLENYVLKPLFSYAGQGVIIDLTPKDLTAITDPENWILQEKVIYAPAIETPSGPAKTEIRLFYFWDAISKKYKATLNLTRLSKGKMIGVAYNANATWVGGSLAYFEA